MDILTKISMEWKLLKIHENVQKNIKKRKKKKKKGRSKNTHIKIIL